MRGTTSAVAMAGLLAACQGPSAPADTSVWQLTDPGDPAPPDSTGDASSGAPASTGAPVEDDSTGGSTSAGTTDPILDVGSGSDLGDLHPVGCGGKIDFLFVISRDENMDYYQKQIVDAFPKFIAAIESKFVDFDYHIMVIDADDHWGAYSCNDDCTSDCSALGYPCDLMDTLTACDWTMGAGTVFPAGNMASNKPCSIAGGRRYMTKDQPNLLETFECVATQGSSGYPAMGQALAESMKPALNGPGGCNDGFLRDDALLMVTFISGGYDYESEGSPKVWAQAVLDAKHGDPRSVVMLDFQTPECPPPDRLCDLKYYFPHFLVFENLDPDWGPAFEQATDLVEAACSEFIPQ